MNDQNSSLWQFMQLESDKLLSQSLQHLTLTFTSLLLAILVGVPVGVWISRKIRLSGFILGVAGVMQTIPSIALLGFLIPVLGIGAKPAIAALLIYALLPIIRNTYTGITGVDTNIREAAIALGMRHWQVLFKVEIPLAMPVILAGIRTAAVINVGVATLASLIAAGGLGEFIFGGISLNNTNMILAGAIPAALLAILLDAILAMLQKIQFKKIKLFSAGILALLVIAGILSILPQRKGNDLKAGFTPEFMGRMDGDLGLQTTYGLKMNPVVISDAVMYHAAYAGEIDVISGYSTDGRLKAYDLTILDDDRHIFPPYDAAPVVNVTALKKFPELEHVVNLLSSKITDAVMTDLNYRTDYLHQSPARVAKDFLIACKLYRPGRPSTGTVVKIGSKIFGEQYILAEIYQMLIRGYTDYGVELKTGLGGTQICFEALRNGEIDFYPEYTGTGLLAILKPEKAVVSRVTRSKASTYAFVKSNFLKKYDMKWLKPIGFNNSYALMMRRKQSAELHVNTITELKNHLDKNQ